jgi:hypothetical protein
MRMISNGTTAQNRYGMIASIVARRCTAALDRSAALCFSSDCWQTKRPARSLQRQMGHHDAGTTHTKVWLPPPHVQFLPRR